VCGSGVLVCSSSLLIRRHQRARCQAETPLTDLFKFAEPALDKRGLLDSIAARTGLGLGLGVLSQSKK
jgi:hypothetical protein